MWLGNHFLSNFKQNLRFILQHSHIGPYEKGETIFMTKKGAKTFRPENKSTDNYLDCPCISTTQIEKQYLLEKFESIREKCSALREILVPDKVWPNFKQIAESEMDEAKHYPILLLALCLGYLNKITLPIHKYLIENGRPKLQIKNQYLEDLIEKWMIPKKESKPKDELKRHQESKIYLGKLIELQIAEYLEEKGWKVNKLEALCGEFDIEASSPDGNEYAIEIKYIGQEDDKFLAIIDNDIPPDRFESLIGKLSENREEEKIKRLIEKSKSRTFDPYSGYNYILLRAYEAAKQLGKSPKNRIIIIIISNLSCGFLEIPINENWMNWRQPIFLDACPQWDEFLLQNIKNNPKKFVNVEKDLQSIFNSVNQIWIIKQGNGFNYSLEKVINFNS
jgi:hypothetical protein